MSIAQLFILAAIALLVGQLKKGRLLALLGVSAIVIYWLQPPQEQSVLTFWLPTATLVLTFLAWLFTSAPEVRDWRQNLPAVVVLLGVIVLMDLNRYLPVGQVFTTATPRPQWIGVLFVVLLTVAIFVSRFRQSPVILLVGAAVSLILLFVLIKVPSILSAAFEALSLFRGKAANGFTALSWLGFSYVAFRLLHTILDRIAGRLPPVPLAEYVNYVIFFPSFVAGPIDRLERFIRDLDHSVVLDREGWLDAGTRFFVGLFKKFVIADALAWIALNDLFAREAKFTVWTWVLLYSYSLRLYFDFSGYTDIAIGLGRLLGIRLPENFASPYLKPNLTQFWNSWHMTLTQWFRNYFFNPLIRALRSGKRPVPAVLMILIAQIATMVLIGLWHGVTVGFVLWGLWHGLGLFVQNRWSDYMKVRMPSWGQTNAGQMALRYSGIFLTFNFVSLGWLFFVLSTPAKVWEVVVVLFGVR